MVIGLKSVVEVGEGVLNVVMCFQVQDQWCFEYGVQGCIIVFFGQDYQYGVVSYGSGCIWLIEDGVQCFVQCDFVIEIEDGWVGYIEGYIGIFY